MSTADDRGDTVVVPQRLGQYDAHMAERFGRRVRQLREERGWSQTVLADRCEFSRPYLSDIENGKVKVSLELAKSIAGGLKVSLPELVEGL